MKLSILNKLFPDLNLKILSAFLLSSILIAAITSCTNTSNPNVLIGAGLLAVSYTHLTLPTNREV